LIIHYSLYKNKYKLIIIINYFIYLIQKYCPFSLNPYPGSPDGLPGLLFIMQFAVRLPVIAFLTAAVLK